MKKYLLIIFGEFKNQKICHEIVKNINPVVDSEHLKYQFTGGSIMAHFASELDQTDVHEFICGISYGVFTTFVLTELNDKLSVNMPKIYSDHLFDLENNGLETIGDDIEDDEDGEDESLASLLNLVKKESKPSLDSILDKIQDKGVGSLTPFEKDVLEEYSQK